MPATSTGSPTGAGGPQHRAPRRRPRRGTALAAGLSAVGAAAVVGALVLGGSGDDGGAAGPSASEAASPAPGGSASTAQDPARAAALWLAGQSPQAGRVAVDPGLYDEVAGTSSLASRLVPVPLTAGATDGLSAQWLVAGAQVRSAAEGSWAAQALAGSREVVAFGEGDRRVEVRELGGVTELDATVDGSASAPSSSAPPTPSAARSTATTATEASLRELASNPRLDFSPRARAALGDEPVDLRLAALLAQLAAVAPLSVSDVPASTSPDEPARTAVLDGVGGAAVGSDPEALRQLQRQLSAQDPSFRAVVTQEQEGSTTVLRLVLPPVTA